MKTRDGQPTLEPILSFPVGPYEVPVYVKDLETSHGYFEFGEAGPRIFIASHTEGSPAFEATLFHELAHAWDEIFGLGLKHRQVRGLGNAMGQSFGQALSS